VFGNQSIGRVLQAKLKVNEPGDAYERQADAVAEMIMRLPGEAPATSSGPRQIQRRCSACEEEDDGLQFKQSPRATTPEVTPSVTANIDALRGGGQPLPPSARAFFEPRFGHELLAHELTHVVQQTPMLSPKSSVIQRMPENGEAGTDRSGPTEISEETPAARETATPGLIVEDSAEEVRAGHMKKSEFLTELRAKVCSEAEDILGFIGRTTEGCPYLDYWFDYYGNQDSQHIERAIQRYSPEASSATTARDYIPIITARVRRGVEAWMRTGELSEVPEGVPMELPGAGSTQSEAVAPEIGSVQFKGRSGGPKDPGSPQAIQAQLGRGRSLNGSVRSRMESAFGTSFSNVRVHDDGGAANLSGGLNARAFTVGEHVAFGLGEYQPGTPVGDAIIAHELAHVVQQRGAGSSVSPAAIGGRSYDALEEDADLSAVGAVASLWQGTKGGFKDIARNAIPRLRSGLRLQRCPGDEKKKTAPSWTVADLKKMLDTCDGGLGIWAKAKRANRDTEPSVTLGSSGFVDDNTGEITIDQSLDKCNALQQLIQELSNLSRIADLRQANASARAGDLSREDYILTKERIEYETGVLNDLVAFDACKDQWPCPTARKEWARRARDFQDYFDNFLSREHKEGYGTWWDTNARAAYERKHPRR
jgi:hypothetical protein